MGLQGLSFLKIGHTFAFFHEAGYVLVVKENCAFVSHGVSRTPNHLGLHCLLKYMSTGFQFKKGKELHVLGCQWISGKSSTVEYKAMLWVHTIGMNCIISEPCYKGTLLQRKYRKMTISWSFSYNFFIKFRGKKIWEPQTVSYPNPCYIEVCCTEIAMYSLF